MSNTISKKVIYTFHSKSSKKENALKIDMGVLF